jgi:hypothetical protein
MTLLKSKLVFLLPFAATLLASAFLIQSVDVQNRSFGYFHDELWDYTPAVAMIQSESLTEPQETKLFHHRVPLVTGPYHGAWKAWISSPILAYLGTSPAVLRTLNAFYAMAYLAAMYWALIPAVGRSWAWVVFLIPLADANFLVTVPIDMGPTIFQNIFIALTLGAIFRYVENRDGKSYRRIWLFSGCLLAQKLTAIPITIALGIFAAILAVRYQHSWILSEKPKALRQLLLVPAVLFVIPMIPHLIYLHKAGLSSLLEMTAAAPTPYWKAISQNYPFFQKMFDGTDWYQRITLDSFQRTGTPLIFIWGLCAMGCAVLLYILKRDQRKGLRFALISGGLAAAGFCLMPLFNGLNRPWHFYILSPLFLAGCAIATIHVLSSVARFMGKARLASGILLACLCFAGVGRSAVQGFELLHGMEIHKGVCLTSPAINDLYAAIQAAHVKSVYAVNYSVAYPIYVLSKGTIRVEEFCWQDMTQERIEELFNRLKTDPSGGILYRYCGCKVGDQEWIRWLNKSPQIGEVIKKAEQTASQLNRISCKDDSETEFVLLTPKKN